MKTTTSLLLLLLVLSFGASAQVIPNGSFESWYDTTRPVGWATTETMLPTIFGNPHSSRDITDRRHLTSSILLKTTSSPFGALAGAIALGENTGIFFTDTSNAYFSGIPFTERPDTFFFSYKYAPAGNDVARFEICLLKNGIGKILTLAQTLGNTNGLWRDAAIPLANYYTAAGVPDSLSINFVSSYPVIGGQVGSVLHIDGVSFTERLCNMAEVNGKVFFDANQNGNYDAGDAPARNQQVSIAGDQLSVTNTNGDYFFFVNPGTYTVKPRISGHAAQFTNGPDSILVNAANECGVYGSNNFTIRPPANYCEGQLNIVNPGAPPRPGFAYSIGLTLSNLYSASPVSTQVMLNFPSSKYVSAIPAPDIVDTVANQLFWNVTNLAANTTWSASIIFLIPSTYSIGIYIPHGAASVYGSCPGFDTLTCNWQTLTVGSYDPNDKSVYPVGYDTGGLTDLSTDQFKYTVRFQNTGTYLAENVRILDTISQHLNINTLKVLSASHPYQVVINGREVAFEFPGIMLPDSNANEPASHGYIQYGIAPANSFMHGTVITNRADIYFDFNAPVLTNTTLSTGSNFLSINDMEDNMLLLYPNPATQLLYIKTGNEPAELVRIYNTAGQLVLQVRQPGTMPLDISSLHTGAYIAEVINSKHTTRQMWVKM